MVKVVQELYFCDVCGEQIEDVPFPLERAVCDIGFWEDGDVVEKKSPRFYVKEFDLCETCKIHSRKHLIAMARIPYTDDFKYGWLIGQEIEKAE